MIITFSLSLLRFYYIFLSTTVYLNSSRTNEARATSFLISNESPINVSDYLDIPSAHSRILITSRFFTQFGYILVRLVLLWLSQS